MRCERGCEARGDWYVQYNRDSGFWYCEPCATQALSDHGAKVTDDDDERYVLEGGELRVAP